MGGVLSVLDYSFPPWARRAERVAALVCVVWAARALRAAGGKGVLDGAYAAARALPGVEGAVAKELEKEKTALEKKLLGEGDPEAVVEMPGEGVPAEAILARADRMMAGHTGYKSGKQWGGIYYKNEPLAALQAQLWARFSSTNLLYPAVFPAARSLEGELVTIVTKMVHGTVGLLTSGGTESILIAILAYREEARRRGILRPEIVCGESAHPAVHKACHYFGLVLRRAPISPDTQRMTVAQTEACLSPSTIAIYASAPTFAHGVVDPIAELGALAQRRNIGLHVDNCLGGFLLSHLGKEGLFTAPWDFRVPGVTTMSVDVHKYGFASKGASAVVFRDNALRHLSYVPSSDGLEGLYITPTLQGARGGGVVAAAWGTVVSLGEKGYRKAARRLHGVMLAYVEAIEAIPELTLLTAPDCATVAMKSNAAWLDIYLLASCLEKRGWNMFTGQKPACMSVCVGEQQTPEVIGAWRADVVASIDDIRRNPSMKVEGTAAVYGAAGSTPTEVLHEVMRSYADMLTAAKKKQ